MPPRLGKKQHNSRRLGRPPGGSEPIIGAILDATLELLGSHGYASLRVEDVAARAGVNKTTIYRRWPAKSDLVTAALQALQEQTQIDPDTGSLRGDVISMLQASRARMQSPAGAAIVRAVVAGDEPGVTQIAQSIWDRAYTTPWPVFNRAIKRGELPRGTDTALLRELLIAPIVHRIFVWHAPADDAFLSSVADSVLANAPRMRR